MAVEQRDPSGLPKLDELVGRDIRVVRQEFSGIVEESRTQFDMILEAAKLAVKADRVITALEDTVPADNGRALCVYINRETRVITRLEVRNGLPYQSVEANPDWVEVRPNSRHYRQK